jgi:transketolase
MTGSMPWWNVGEEISLRDAFGRALCHLAGEREDFVLFDADVAGGTGAKPFIEEHPGRVMQFGIAEQNMMAAAAGFATGGLIPVVSGFAAFLMMRSHEQLRTAVAFGGRNVKVCCSHVGLDVGPDGATAQMLEDLAVARSIPKMTVVVPADANELMMALEAILDRPGPTYMRIGRSEAPVFLDGNEHRFEVGRASVHRRGDDVALIACGPLVARALDAAETLAGEGISATVINLSTIKPIDEECVVEAARRTGAIVTAEDHNIHGGMGSAVCEVLSQKAPTPVEMVAVKDVFGASGEAPELAERFGIAAADIAAAAHRAVERKN